MSRPLLLLSFVLASGPAFAQSPAGETHPAKPEAHHAAPTRHEPHATKPRPVPVVQPPKGTHPPRQPRHPPAAPPATPAPPPETPAQPAPETPAEPTKGSVTGLPIPRFVAFRSDDVNLRAGPGTRYQIDWVYHRRDLPVEVLREFEVWRLVQDMDGIKGWVHQATLAGRRTFITRGDDQTMRRSADDASGAVAILKPGVIGRIISCPANGEWCEVQTGDYRGYLKRSGFFGTYPGEAIGN